MKGIVFNLLEGVVSAQFGDDAWDDMLDGAGACGAYTAVGSYADGEFVRLLDATPQPAGRTDRERLRWFGRRAIPVLAARYPHFFSPHADTCSFLATLNDIIHPEVRKLYPGAEVPVFDFEAPADVENVVRLGYRSARRLCWLAEGFILGTADHYGQDVALHQACCMHDGADHCLIECVFDEASDAARAVGVRRAPASLNG